jgi:hypothetical protein
MSVAETTVDPRGAEIDLGHRTVRLRLDMGAMAQLQDAAGTIDLREVETWIGERIPLKASESRLDINALVTIACAMGWRNEPPLKRAELAELEIGRMADVGIAVAMAFVAARPTARPEAEDGKASPPKARKRG